jgi:hypothetical protein
LASLWIVHVSWVEFWRGLLVPHVSFDRHFALLPLEMPIDRNTSRPRTPQKHMESGGLWCVASAVEIAAN